MAREAGGKPTAAVLATVFATAALALVAFAMAAALAPVRWDGRTMLLALLLGGMTLGARLFPLHVAPKAKVTVATAPVFAAVLVLPAPAAIAVAATAAATAQLALRAPWFQALHTTAESAVRVAAGAGAFALVAGDRPLADLSPGTWIPAAAIAALAMEGVNIVVVDAVISAQLRKRPLRGVRARLRLSLAPQAALYLLGLLVAAVGAHEPWLILLLIVPAWVVHRSLRDSIALRVHTRRALEELADAVDARDPALRGRSARVAALARATAEAMRLPAERVEAIELGARLRDIGMTGIEPAVLDKQAPLTEAEWHEVFRHPEAGARMLAGFPELGGAREVVLAHHERFDGGGYPRGLADERIPLAARIVAVADAWAAMTSSRPHGWALPADRARAELEAGRGTQFDPAVVDAFLRVLAKRPHLARPAAEVPPAADVGPGRAVPNAAPLE